MRTATTLRVETAVGTSLTATFDPVAPLGQDQRHHQRALLVEPAGRRSLHDAGVGRRRLRLQRHRRRLLRPEVRRPAPTPLTLEIASGRLVAARCERAELEREFWDYCHTDETATASASSPSAPTSRSADMIGILLQDEKIPGVHLAFGDPYGSQTGADWKSRTHIDVLTRECDVWIDEEQVIRDGRVAY